MSRILTGEHFRTPTVVFVVAAGIIEEPLRRLIVMLIDEVDIEFPHLLPAIVEVLAIGRRPRCATNLYIRILCAYLLDEHLEALCIERSPLFVADTYLLEIERLRMAEPSTYLSPLGIDVTIAELDEVEGIVDIRL